VQEFDILDDEANIYKQIGPVLLKQDKTEALMSVNGRLEFIEKEIKRIEAQIKGIQEKSEKLKVEVGYPLWYYKSNGTDTLVQIIQIQNAAQQQQQQQQQQAQVSA
jgi:prefoldin beta subunit